MNGIISYILFTSSIWGFTISSVLFIAKRNRKANRVLALFLFFVARGLLQGYFTSLDMHIRFPHLLWLTFPHMFIFGPLLYIYCRVLTRNVPIFSAEVAYHAIPFVASLVYLGLFFYALPGHEKLARFNAIETSGPPLSVTIMGIAGRISGMTYSLLSFLEVRSYTKRIKGYFSDIHQVNLNWLQVILGMVICAWSLSSVSFVSEAFLATPLEAVDGATNLVAFLLFYTMSYLMIQQPDLYNWVEHLNAERVLWEEKRESVPVGEKRGQKSINLNEASLEFYRNEIYRCIEEERPYLDSLLTIKKLSSISRVPVNVLSYIINTETGNNFYHFINRYRIDHAAALLLNEDESDTRILEIAYSSGFNSKSVFNTMFRKFLGTTPRDYRTQGAPQ